MFYVILIIVVLLVLLIVIISYYNKMVSKKTYMEEAWSGIDVFLKKRYDLIPSLVDVVKGYASHEKELLESLTQQRANVLKSNTSEERIESENKLGHVLANVLAISENYPDLKANTNFLQLQDSLSKIESEIESARRYYNGTVRNNNILIESFPGNVFAGMFNFSKGIFFKMDEVERERPTISF